VARRNSASGILGLAILCVIAFPFLLLMKIANSIGAAALILGLIAVIGIIIAFRIYRKAARLADLTKKYGDEAIAKRIMQRTFWLGQTNEQLIDSLGYPIAKDNVLLKTRKREVWKYEKQGKNRYGLRITLDDDLVAGWDHKHQ